MKAMVFSIAALATWSHIGLAAAPPTINHQGVVSVNGQLFTGTGQFKFAIVDSDGLNRWTNDGTSLTVGGVPSTSEPIPVANGVYSVLLGDNMEPIPSSIFNDASTVLRIWFDDGVNGQEQLSPDHPLAAAPYAHAVHGLEVDSNGNVAIEGRLGVGEDLPGTDIELARDRDGEVNIAVNNSSSGVSALSELIVGTIGSSGRLMTFGSGFQNSLKTNRVAVTANGAGLDLVTETPNTPIRLFTGAHASTNQRMTIDGTGKVGVGTPSPITSLHMDGQSLWLTGGDGSGLPASAGPGLRLYHNGGQAEIFSWDYQGGGPQDLILQRPGGNVGIGTDSPQGALHVRGSTQNVDCHLQSINPTNARARLMMRTPEREFMIENDGAANAWNVKDVTAGADRLSIAYGGAVGVGTVSPLTKLDVRGSFAAETGKFFVGDAGSGYVETRGSAGSINVVLTSLAGFLDNGYVSVRDSSSTTQAGMYVDSSGNGIVFGDVKSFREPHRTKMGKEIWYASLEGPEAGAYVRGTARLINGKATVIFPDHFESVASEQGLTIQLTPLSAESQGLSVTKDGLSGFHVIELQSGRGNYEFDYMVMAVRKRHQDFQVERDSSESRPNEPADRPDFE